MALEILFAPYDVYWAPVGESFPIIEAAPAGNWLILGTSVAERTNEDGVIGVADFVVVITNFALPPGPSGLACAGTPGCTHSP